MVQICTSLKHVPILKKNARVVICGVELWVLQLHTTLLIRTGSRYGGTTWKSSELLDIFKTTLSQVKLPQASNDLYMELNTKCLPTDWKECGSLNLARTKDRMIVVRRTIAQSVLWNIESELLKPIRCKEECLLISEARSIVVRDLDGHAYFPEFKGRLLAGGFERISKPAFEDGHIPASGKDHKLPEYWDDFHVSLEQLLHRIPDLKMALLDHLCNSTEAFSRDCKWIIGEVPEIRNYYVAAGLKTVDIIAAGRVGQATRRIITLKRVYYSSGVQLLANY